MLVQLLQLRLFALQLPAQILDLVHQRGRAFECPEGEVFRRKKEVTFAPTHIRLKNLRMPEPRAVIRERASDRRWTHVRSESIDDCLANRFEFSRAHHFPV
jgi:hypothetical protein